jgi:hypothetical protein
MADTMILAENVLIEFYKDGVFSVFRCATEVSITTRISTKPVRTIGDGKWERTRGQKIGYSVSMAGLIDIDESAPTTWLLQEAAINMTHINFRLYFSEPQTTLEKIFEGAFLITESNLGGGSTGFATGSFSFEGFGPYEIKNALTVCNATIGSLSVGPTLSDPPEPNGRTVTFNNPQNASRIDFYLDGGGRDSIFGIQDGVSGFIRLHNLSSGSHTITLIPICDDDQDGTPISANFTI